MHTDSCESCLMPFKDDTGVREDPRYCSLCFRDGAFCYQGDRKGFQKVCYQGMREKGMNPITARIFSYMVRFAPRWRA